MRAIIIDDERLARTELRKLLQDFPEVEVVDEAANADEAINKIDTLQPDLVFLDIQMPGKTGFDMLAELERAPHVIFTTAYDEYALKAFEVNALDYLLKPIEPKRLADAMQKLHIAETKENHILPENFNQSILTEADQVFVKDCERCWFVKLSDIRLFESVGNYAKVFFGANKPLILKSLNALEERLDQKTFFRANRKHIVNLRMIEKIEVSRRQTVKFKEMMSL